MLRVILSIFYFSEKGKVYLFRLGIWSPESEEIRAQTWMEETEETNLSQEANPSLSLFSNINEKK